jgi:glutaminyl-tRNA synthetase
MTVINPVKVVITNYPDGQVEELTAENNQENEALGVRTIHFSKELYIERADFMEVPVKKFFRLAPDKEVRLKFAYIIKCEEVIKDGDGNIVEIHCTYDPESKSGSGANANRKVKGTLHWVSAADAVDVETRLYDYLLKDDAPEDDPDAEDTGHDFLDMINPHSLDVFHGKAEACIAAAHPGDRFQFLREGYFVIDKDSTPEHIIINRIVGLRDTWGKMQKKAGK